jgi:hypothetical protein
MADQSQDLAKVVARALSDSAFKAQLLNEPAAALAAAGVDLPEGVTVKVVENTESLFHLVLPRRPDGELDDAALDKIAGGTNQMYQDLKGYAKRDGY